MSTGQPEALDRAVARIVDAMRPEAIYLFGSRARGDARGDSDYDLLVVVADDAPQERRSLAVTTRVMRDPGVPLDIVPGWLAVVDDDLRQVANNLGGPMPSLSGAAYHCQQAAEKLTKALLVEAEIVFPKTDDIAALV